MTTCCFEIHLVYSSDEQRRTWSHGYRRIVRLEFLPPVGMQMHFETIGTQTSGELFALVKEVSWHERWDATFTYVVHVRLKDTWGSCDEKSERKWMESMGFEPMAQPAPAQPERSVKG